MAMLMVRLKNEKHFEKMFENNQQTKELISTQKTSHKHNKDLSHLC